MDADLTHLVTLIDMGRQFQRKQQTNMRIAVIPAAISMGGIFLLHGGLPLAAAMFYGGLGLGVKNALQPVKLCQLINEKS